MFIKKASDLPPPQVKGGIGTEAFFVLFKFVLGEDEATDLAINKFFGFLYIPLCDLYVEVSDEHEVNNAGIFTMGIVAGDKSNIELANPVDQIVDDVVNYLVEAKTLVDNLLNLREQRMAGVSAVADGVPFFRRNQEAGLAEIVQFVPDGIGRFTKFLSKAAKVRA